MEQQALVQEILGGVAEMMKDMETRMNDRMDGIERRMDAQRNEIFTFIENGVQKDVRLLSEKVTSMDKRLTDVEDTLAGLCEDMTVVKAAVTHQEHEIYELKRVKG